MPAPPDKNANTEVQIAQISYEPLSTLGSLLQEKPKESEYNDNVISNEQLKDPELQPIINYLTDKALAENTKLHSKTAILIRT